MKVSLRIRPDAESDIQSAFEWYESKNEGLGHDFLRAVEACLDMIQRQPLGFPRVHKSLRRHLLRRFPYGIFYTLSTSEIVVLACFHASRSPHKWMKRR